MAGVTPDFMALNGRKLAASALALALVLAGGIALLPGARAIPIPVEFRCGWNVFPAGTNITMWNGTAWVNVPEGCLLQFVDAGTLAVVATNTTGKGLEPAPGAGRFDITFSLDTTDMPIDIFVRAYNNVTPGTSTAYGDSATFQVTGGGPYNITGWQLDVGQTPSGGDTPSTNGTGSIGINNFGAPMSNSYDLRLYSSNGSVLNQQIDVEQEYYFEVNVTDMKGTGNLKTLTITAWHDGGDDANSSYGLGFPNTQFALQYNYHADTTQVVSTVTPGEPEISVARASLETYSDANTSTMRVYFSLGSQIRHAPGPAVWMPASNNGSTPADGFNDENTWNFHVNVTNDDDQSLSFYDEFAVYRYTAINSPSLDVSSVGLPGQAIVFPAMLLNFSTNAQYNVYTYIDAPLARVSPPSPPASIGPGNVYASGGELPMTQFSGVGEANALYVYQNHPAPNNGSWQEVGIYFTVSVPLNTLSGYYEGDLVYSIEQY